MSAKAFAVPPNGPRKGLGHWPTIYALAWALSRCSRPVGRRTLVRRTGITEMTVRTHLNKLRDAGYVKMAKAGTSLTAQGLEAFAPLKRRVRWVGAPALRALALDDHGAAALLRSFSEKLTEGWRYRDAAVREGATGALLLRRDEEGWTFSDQPLPLRERYPEDAALLDNALSAADVRPQEGDALVIAFAPEPSTAQRGLWRVVVELLPPSELALREIASSPTSNSGG